MFSGFESPVHLLILLLIILLLFGGKRVPELARGLGQGIHEFKKGLSGRKEPKEEKEKRPVAVEEAQEGPNRVKTSQEEEQQQPQKKEAAT